MKYIIYTLIFLLAQSSIISTSDTHMPHTTNNDNSTITPEPYFTFEVCTMTPEQKEFINNIVARAQAQSQKNEQTTESKNNS